MSVQTHGSPLNTQSSPMAGDAHGYGTQFFQYIEKRRRDDSLWLEERKQWKAKLIEAIRWNQFDFHHTALSPHVSQNRKEFVRRKLLNDLKFLEMSDRSDRIAEAHEKTFDWIFKEPRTGAKSWESFLKWLESGESLYWITGKAGSGKSTLMKYVYSNYRTLDHLESWAADVPLVTAAFFFWNSGTDLQMSQTGLLRTILYQVFQKEPELIPRILSERWEIYNLFGEDSHAWTEVEMKLAFTKLMELDSSSFKFCFFIDGLDEFSGNPEELIRFIKSITAVDHIRVCVASRPWVEFEDAFQTSPSLLLENLTYDDIKEFVNSSFHQDPGFVELGLREPEYASQLLEAIVQKASGVFLWVTLVVASLLAGLVNGDRVCDLEKRLALLPPDLEKLYQKMLDSLDPFYLGHASALFQLIRVEPEATLLLLSFADESLSTVLARNIQPLIASEADLRERVMRRRIKSRCKGLLEVGSDRHNNISANPLTSAVGGEDVHDPLAAAPVHVDRRLESSPVVQYLHRTVKDFLISPKVWDWLREASETGFEPRLALCKAYLLQLKVCLPYHGWGGTAKACLDHAQQLSKYSNDAKAHSDLALLLAELDHTAETISGVPEANGTGHTHPWTPGPAWIENRRIFPSPGMYAGRTFLSLAVRLGLYSYVSANVKTGCIMKQPTNKFLLGYGNNMIPPSQTLTTTGIWPLLLDACIEDYRLGETFPAVTFSAKMVNILLANGANPYFKAPDAKYSALETIARANRVRELRLIFEETQLGNVLKAQDRDLMLHIAANNQKHLHQNHRIRDLVGGGYQFWQNTSGRLSGLPALPPLGSKD